jgi:hypothetical protein
MSVTKTSAVGRLPNELDWNVYQLVRVQQWSTRAAAKEFDISQSLVCQIVQRMGKFFVQSIKVPSKELAARQLAAGRQLAAERIDFFVNEAVRCFRKSQSPVKSVHEDSASRRCTSTRVNHGDIRYLNAAARLTLIASTLPPPLVMIDAADFEETDFDETDFEPMVDESAPDNHPEEDCSDLVAEQPEETEPAATSPSATAAAMMSCVEQSRHEQLPAQSSARPVQATKAPGESQASRREKFFQTG